MAVKGVVFLTVALILGIAALVLHLLAIASPHWKIIKRDREPAMAPVSYGLWERCEHVNFTVMKQGVALGIRPHVQICVPNRYMRYCASKFHSCYQIRRNCPVISSDSLPEGCSCRYLPSTKGLQWLTILAAIFLIFGLLLLYLNTISTGDNKNGKLVLSFGPFLCFLLALLLLITGLILLGAYLRRDIYEDYSFPLQAVSNDKSALQFFDLHSLRNYAKYHEETFSRDRLIEAEKELRLDADTHYHAVIGRATIYEIIATALVFVATAVTFWFTTVATRGTA